MSEPKNQHIIPKCYLNQFVDPGTPVGQEPYVWIFDRNTKKGKNKAPKNILAETDFYTLKMRKGKKDYVIEKTLAQIEGEYATVFEKKISKRIPLEDDEHLIVCVFVAAMLQRTLKQKENIENFFDQIIELVETLEKARGIDPKTSLEWKQQKEDAHKVSLVQMIPHITEILMKMNLAFLCTSRQNSFITSDAPCYLFNSRLQWQEFYSPGLGQKHVEVILPLSPEISICFSWINNLRGYVEIGTDVIHELNRSTVGHSHQYFIARSPKIKRRWFQRFPLDPVFISRILLHKTKRKITRYKLRRRYRRKQHV